MLTNRRAQLTTLCQFRFKIYNTEYKNFGEKENRMLKCMDYL